MTNQEIAAKAAQWWADKLTFNQQPGWLAGHTVEEAVGEAITNSLRPAAPADAAVARFKELLAERIEASLGEWNVLQLDVDYRPDEFLKKVALAAGVLPERLPKKTGMHIRGEKIFVRSGQGSPQTELT